MNEEIARAFVRILADTSRFGPEAKAKIEAALARLHPEVEVDAETRGAEAKLAALDVIIDRIDSADPDVDVHANTGGATASLAEVAAEAEAVDSLDPDVDVHVDDHGTAAETAGRLGNLLAIIAAIGPATIPMGAALVGGLSGVAAAAGAGIAGLGATALGVSGVTGAVKALSAEQDKAGATATRSASTQVGAAQRIESAEASLRNTRASAAYAAEQAAERVTAAVEQERRAEDDLAYAQQQARRAQDNLRQAREDAQRQLEDMRLAVEDGALAEQQAIHDVEQAQFDLNRVKSDPRASELEREQAQLTYEQAQQHLKDLQVQNKRLGEDAAEAAKKGVTGTDTYQSALRNLESANRQVADAQDRVADAERAVTDAREASAEQARQSAFSISQAQRAVAEAQRAAAASAVSQAGAEDKVAEAMAHLSPTAREFARTVNHDLLPAFYDARAAAQTGLLPGVQTALEDLIATGPDLDHFLLETASEMGHLADEAGQALNTPFWRTFFDYVDRTAVPTLSEMGDVTGNLAHGFAGLMEAFEPLERQMGAGLVRLTDRFADFGEAAGTDSEFNDFLVYVQTDGARAVHVLGDLTSATGSLLESLSAAGGPLLTIVDLIAKLVDEEPDLAAFVLQLWAWNRVIGSIARNAEGMARGLGFLTAAETAQATAASRAAVAEGEHAAATAASGRAAKGAAGAFGPLGIAVAAVVATATFGYGKWKQYDDQIKQTTANARTQHQTFTGLTEALQRENDHVEKGTKWWSLFGIAATLAAADLRDKAGDALENTTENVDGLAGSLHISRDAALGLANAAGVDVTQAMGAANDVIVTWVANNLDADKWTRAHAGAVLTLATYTNLAADASQGFAAGLERIFDIESNSIRTADRFKLSLKNLEEQVSNGTTALRGNSREALNNRLAIEGLTDQIKGAAQDAFDTEYEKTNDVTAARKAGTDALKKYTEKLEDELIQMGFNRDEVDRLLGKLIDLHSTPWSYEVKGKGVKKNKQDLEDIHRLLQEIDAHSWHATLIADLQGIDTGVGAPKGDLTGLLQVPIKGSGGPVDRLTSYIVGDTGPELFTPDVPGYIHPPDSPLTRAAMGAVTAQPQIPTVITGGAAGGAQLMGWDDTRIVAAIRELIRAVRQQTAHVAAQPDRIVDGLNGVSRGARQRYQTAVL